MRFGRWTALWEVPERKNTRIMWHCKCDCGKESDVYALSLTSGKSKSCGCLKSDINRLHNPNEKHGLCKKDENGKYPRIFRIWCGMKKRCYSPSEPTYKNYGGRGIRICSEWYRDYRNFYTWAMSNGYADNLTIDRIDNEKGYFPENCRWVDRKTQSLNRRKFKAPGRYVKVLCVETGELFESVQCAAESTCTGKAGISACLHGKQKTAGGYHWEKAEV